MRALTRRLSVENAERNKHHEPNRALLEQAQTDDMAYDVIRRTGPYFGIFLTSLATMMYEIALTRIFSVTMWYHYAFAAISIAMFGMTVGGNLVFLFPNYFRPELSKYHLSLYSFHFALSITLSFLSYLCIPFIGSHENTIVDYYSIIFTYFIVSIPFIFSGICVCLCLTRFPTQISKLYSADLAGAAFGCVTLWLAMGMLDGPTAIIFCAFLASIGTLGFLSEGRARTLRRFTVAISILFITIVVGNWVAGYQQKPFLKLRWVKGAIEPKPLYEKWNTFSRVQVFGSENELVKPDGPGMSQAYMPTASVRRLKMLVDSASESEMLEWDGDLNRLEHLKHDVRNFPYLARLPKSLLIVGTGGGKDVLSGLAFNAGSIVGVELNANILDVLNHRFGDFTGRLDQDKKVRFVHDEARSYITRQTDSYDMIQIPMIDTWAATAAGAYALSENALYTVEACRTFLEKLSPDGMLAYTRWTVKESGWEVYRLTSLAVASLRALGLQNPREHIALVSCYPKDNSAGVGCLMISRNPFTEIELDRMERLAASMMFTLDLSPREATEPILENLASGRPFEEFAGNLPVNLNAPTDDSPFFFNMLRWSSMFDSTYWNQGPTSFNMEAIFTLGLLLAAALALTLLFIVLPLVIRADTVQFHGCIPLFLLFGSIGAGFMLIEISQMQRLMIFLGHPAYGLTVALFTALFASGVGSLLTQRIANPGFIGTLLYIGLLLALALFGWRTPDIISSCRADTNFERILVSIGMLFSIGIFMGMAFPLGMKVALSRSSSLAPWLWGVNGAISVLASILSVVIAITNGISAAYWIGVACYGVALLAFVWACRTQGYSIIPGPDRQDAVTILVDAEPVE